MSTTGANALLDAYFGSSSPSNLYLGVFAGQFTGSAPTEPSGANGYARLTISNTVTNFPAAASGIQYLATEQRFNYATSNWIAVSSWGFFAASTGGLPIVWGTLNTSRAVGSGDGLVIPANALTIRY